MKQTELTKTKISESKTKLPKKYCESCGKNYSRHISNQKYCSDICAGNAKLPIGSIRNSNKHKQYLQIKTENGWEHQHRVIMENYLGRKLNEGEEVHHINGDKHDNRLENLSVLDKKEHSKIHDRIFREYNKLKWKNKWLLEKLKGYGWRPKK